MNETVRPGNTWTPRDPDDIQDRIDFVYYDGTNISVDAAHDVGPTGGDITEDFELANFPSDHRAVVTDFTIPDCWLLGDLTGDCTLDTADWVAFKTGQHLDLSAMSLTQAYGYGDLNQDLANNHADFVLFKNAYEDAHGLGTFEQMVRSVPEPSTIGFCGVGLAMLLTSIRRRTRGIGILPVTRGIGILPVRYAPKNPRNSWLAQLQRAIDRPANGLGLPAPLHTTPRATRRPPYGTRA